MLLHEEDAGLGHFLSLPLLFVACAAAELMYHHGFRDHKQIKAGTPYPQEEVSVLII